MSIRLTTYRNEAAGHPKDRKLVVAYCLLPLFIANPNHSEFDPL